jgi:hypothetical protein
MTFFNMLSSGLKYSAMYVSKQGFAVLFEANRLKLGSDGNIETRISNSLNISTKLSKLHPNMP